MTDRGKPQDIWVAFSYAGEQRALVKQIATALEKRLGRGRVFFDEWYRPWLLDDSAPKLREIYRLVASLVAVGLSEAYGIKVWPGLEGKAIRDRRMEFPGRLPKLAVDFHEVFLIRFDDGNVSDYGATDIYIDARLDSVDSIVNELIAKLRLARPDLIPQILAVDPDNASRLSLPQLESLGKIAVDCSIYVDVSWVALHFESLALSPIETQKAQRTCLDLLTEVVATLVKLPPSSLFQFLELLRLKLSACGQAQPLQDWLLDAATNQTETLRDAIQQATIKAPMLAHKYSAKVAQSASSRIQVIIDVDDHQKDYTVLLAAPDFALENGVLKGGHAGSVTKLSDIPALFAEEFQMQTASLQLNAQTQFEFIAPLELLSEGLSAWVFNRGSRTAPICLSYVSYLRSYELKYVVEFHACHDDATRLWQAHCANANLGGWHVQHDVHELKAIVPWNPMGAVCMTGFVPGAGAKLLFDELINCGTPIALCLSAQGNHCDALKRSIGLHPHADWATWVFEHHRNPGARKILCDAITLYYDNPNDPVPQLPGRNNNGRFYVPTLRKSS